LFADVTRLRLERHGLAPELPAGTPLAAVAAAMAGVHAQVPSAGEHSLALRVAGATRTDVRGAIDEEQLVRTFGPRGTVHLLPAADLGWWMAALGSVPGRSPFADGVRLDLDETEAVVAAIDRALSDGEMTLDELNVAVGEIAGAWAVAEVMPAFQTLWPRWRQAINVAAFRGVLCFGGGRGRKVTYRRPSSCPPVEPEAGVERLVEAYLRAYGPGTPEGFAPWVGAPLPWARNAFERYAGARVQLEDAPAWLARGDVVEPGVPASGVLLLPYFDAYVVGGRPRSLLYPGAAAARALTPSGQAGNYPVLLVDGVVAGVWHGRRSGKRVAVTVEPLRRLGRAHRAALDDAVARLGEVVEAAPTLTVGPVAAGAHA
jgi:hypothetical protein